MGTRYNRFFGPVRDAVMRWLFWFVVLLAVVWWMRRRFFAADLSRPRGERGAGRKRGKSSGEAEPMVQCARCGVFVPASEAVRAGGQTFCCEAHRQEGTRARE
jgi:uncharacterized protein